jgi:hypothetical protein
MRVFQIFALLLPLQLAIGHRASASPIPVQQAGFEKANKYIGHGVLIGGFDHGLQALLSLRRNFDAESKVERIVIEMASDVHGQGPERPGFFHFSFQKKSQRKNSPLITFIKLKA